MPDLPGDGRTPPIDRYQGETGGFGILSVGSADHRHQFRDLLALIGFAAAGNGVFDAMGHVIAQKFFLGPP